MCGLCLFWWVWFCSLLLGSSQFVIALRLIMSGDVELNPGPLDQEDQEILSRVDDTTFEGDDWNMVIDECSSLAAKWEQISGFLGLPHSRIASIRGNHPNDNTGCWNDALLYWIIQKYNTKKFGKPSWKTLVKAISKVNKLEFKRLAAEHSISAPLVSVQVHDVEKRIERLTLSTSNVHTQESKGDTDTTHATKSDGGLATTAEHKLEATVLSDGGHQEEGEGSSTTITTTTESKGACVSISEITSHLDLLKPTYQDSHLPPLRHQPPGLADAKTFDAVMSVVEDYCSFFNYSMLEHLINKLGTEKDKENLAKYKEAFARYGERPVFECPPKVGEMREEGYANMIVTLDDAYNGCTVNHIYSFIGNLEKTLNISHLRLCRIDHGRINLIFQLTYSVQQAIFPLSSEQKAELSRLGVVRLSCENYQTLYQCSPLVSVQVHDGEKRIERLTLSTSNRHTQESKGATDTTHATKSDGGLATTAEHKLEAAALSDGGHQEEGEGSSTTVTTTTESKGDGELSSMAAGLAVGKPGDTCSISADSAIGTSSFITGTTAGVTQFSEDLVNRELCDLGIGMGHGVAGASTENELHLASRRGDLEKVKELVEKGQFDPLQKSSVFGMNSVHYSGWGGQLGVLRYFIKETGCNPASQDNRAFTPLQYASTLLST